MTRAKRAWIDVAAGLQPCGSRGGLKPAAYEWAVVAVVVSMFATGRGASVRALGLPSVSAADARQILVDSSRRHRARSEEYLGEVIVVARDGRARSKTWRSYRDGPVGSSDRLIRFLAPAEVRGVGYLARHRPGKDPDEWLYLPSMKRERRIGAKDRDSAFVGTSFSYEDLDLLEFDPARYDASLLAPETRDGVAVHVIALVPRVASAYSRKVARLRTDNLNLLSVDFYSRDSADPVKHLSLTDYVEVDGYLVATRVEMADLRKSSRTSVILHEVKLDRPQPVDRYTIQNLVRDSGDTSAARPAAPGFSRLESSSFVQGAPISKASALTPGPTSGFVEAKAFLPWGAPAGTPANWGWSTALLRVRPAWGSARLDAAVRFEASPSPQIGALTFDVADRRTLRSPASIRTLAISMPLRPGLDVQVGRFDVAWGATDGYSPADAFLPRDFSDPLTEERLPVWGADVRVEHHGVRYEVLAVPVLTPWRLALNGRRLPFPAADVTLVESAWTVPTRGFGAGRVMGSIAGWDVSAWGRAGGRPAPVLVATLPSNPPLGPPVPVPLSRHFTTERAGGGSVSHPIGAWIVNAELGVSVSPDPSVRHAAIWTLGASRVVRNGLFTATVAASGIAPPTNPLLLPDRALLPAAIVAVHQYESWGSWRAVWVSTFHTAGGVLSVEATRALSEAVGLTIGADVPGGAPLSPATAFAGGKRARAAIRWSW